MRIMGFSEEATVRTKTQARKGQGIWGSLGARREGCVLQGRREAGGDTGGRSNAFAGGGLVLQFDFPGLDPQAHWYS